MEKARFNLSSFLGMNNTEKIIPEIPGSLPELIIDQELAFEMAQTLNPEILSLRQKELQAEQTLDRAVKNARFNANLNLSYGLNQSSEELNQVYNDPLDQQMVNVSINIPLLDWGDRKGQKQMAQKQKEVVDIEVKQSMLDFEQEVKLKVIDFNLQGQVVASAAKADTLARQSYELTQRRFLLGKADVLKLTSSMSARQRAREKYITSLATYWQYYYQVQGLTLFDFKNRRTLEEDFKKLIEE